jgi:homoserine kinase
MGSSAASAAACAIAISELVDGQRSSQRLLSFAGSGEKASAGAVHYDNVAASLFGGFVVVNPSSDTGVGSHIDFWRFLDQPRLRCVVAVPKIKVPKQKTKALRGVLPKNVKFSDAMKNLASAVSIVAQASKSQRLETWSFAHYISDQIIEPARKKMIPGFDKVKKNALDAGAHACTISGAGPSVIAFVYVEERIMKKVGEAMKKGFKSAKVDCEIVICKPSKGPEIVKIVK